MKDKRNITFRSRCEALTLIPPKIKELRYRLGVTQGDFAQEVGVSQAQVSHWESGKGLPSVEAFLTIARLAPDAERNWWLQQAGLDVGMNPVNSPDYANQTFPLLKDSTFVRHGGAEYSDALDASQRMAVA